MKGFGVILSAVALAVVFAVPVVSLSGCDYVSKSRAGEAAWTTTLQGQGGQIVGGSVGFAAVATPAPTPWPLPAEQLEKGNEARVAAQVSAQAQADAVRLSYGDVAAVPAPTPCVGGACLMATPSPSATAQGERSSGGSGGGAWYNGFLP